MVRTKDVRQFLKALYSPEDRQRFQAAVDLGAYAEGRWRTNPGSIQELLRRLTFSLNEESGATGWGAPEAIGEIAARIPEMEKLYGSVFPGYLSHPEVFLDNAVLNTGALWAIGRLGAGSSADVPGLDEDLSRFLRSEAASVRGAAIFAIERTNRSGLCHLLHDLTSDGGTLVLPIDGAVTDLTVGELARAAITSFQAVT